MLGEHGSGNAAILLHIVHGNDRLDDVTGVDLAGEQAAFDHAADILQKLLRTSAGQDLDSTYLLEVADAHGNYLFPVSMDLPIIQQVKGGERDADWT
jgi:hypothetical protein